MKAVIGVDVLGLYESALNFLGRMEIPSAGIDLLHVDEVSGVTPPESFAFTAEVLEMERETDRRVLLDAEDSCKRRGLIVDAKNVFVGLPAHCLIERADAIHADLIAISSTRKTKYGSFFFGSVGRALAIGSHHSVLIAKGEVAASGKITAVFATDHSKYADDAIVLLARLNPKGFGRVILVTALENRMIEGANDVEREDFKNYMETKSRKMVVHLCEAGIPAEYKVVSGEFDAVIESSMTENKAELLILGAQGHGFMERLFIGSSSLQQVVATSHSVMILRP